jgi:Arc/MetJ family transcription regulator
VHRKGSQAVRTNIDIDDKLMTRAMRASGKATKRAVVEEALRLLVQTKGQGSIRRLKGKITWEGNLDESRLSRFETHPDGDR